MATNDKKPRRRVGAFLLIAKNFFVKLDNSFGRGTDNVYLLKETGEWLTQEEAREHAMNVVGKHMRKSDWYW